MTKFVTKKVNIERWKQAQEYENDVWKTAPRDHDDWNFWWSGAFDNYIFLTKYPIKSILEVGCGPYARNLRHILNIIGGDDKTLYLEDPLINEYINDGKWIINIPSTKIALPLEEMIIENKIDLIICINVLDHAYDVKKCFDNMLKSLNNKGIIIFGQDLTNKEDVQKVPIADIGHPIRIDLNTCEKALKDLTPIYKKVLDREIGRNPGAHYATLIYAGIKN